MTPTSGKQTPAFTRLELLACLGAAALLITVIVPALANSGARSDRVVCFNNLRQIGVAYGQFGLEHQDRPPWRTPYSQGGLNATIADSNPNDDAPFGLANQLYAEFSTLSNYVSSPRILRDPADRRRSAQVAQYWDRRLEGGLQNVTFQNRAVSYFLGLDGDFRLPQAVLSGDRNLLATPNSTGCSSGITPASEVTPSATGWINDVHGLAGNILFYDGSVAQVDSAGLRSAFAGSPLDVAGTSSGAIHLLFW